MGMHQPGWRERNEERASHAWDADLALQLAVIRAACDAVEAAARASRDCAWVIIGATERISDANDELFKIRSGPENPSDH